MTLGCFAIAPDCVVDVEQKLTDAAPVSISLASGCCLPAMLPPAAHLVSADRSAGASKVRHP